MSLFTDESASPLDDESSLDSMSDKEESEGKEEEDYKSDVDLDDIELDAKIEEARKALQVIYWYKIGFIENLDLLWTVQNPKKLIQPEKWFNFFNMFVNVPNFTYIVDKVQTFYCKIIQLPLSVLQFYAADFTILDSGKQSYGIERKILLDDSNQS